MTGPAPSVCVGRSAELDWLNRNLASALGGAGRVALLSAEAGSGKSTLSERFLATVAEDHPDVLVIRATCSEQYGGGEPYQPFVEAFRALMAPEDASRRRRGIREVAKELAPHWAEAIPLAGEVITATMATASELRRSFSRSQGEESPEKRSLREVAKELAPYWVAAIPVAGEVIAATMNTASELRRQFGDEDAGAQAPSEEALFFQYTKLFFAAAEERPILLFIDDLHWADRASVNLLVPRARRLHRSRVLILGTLRPVDVKVTDHPLQKARQEMAGAGVAEELELGPIAADDQGTLAATVLGGEAEDDLLGWLQRRAGTNTLFFVELLRWLVQNGHAVERRGRWRLGSRPDEVNTPRSAESTIEKRLDRLDPDTFRILEYAAVQGTDFLTTTLARLLGTDRRELEARLEPLERSHRLIRAVRTLDLPDGGAAKAYAFSHSLVQDVLHASLKGKRRILLHRKMAELLEEVHVEDRPAVAHKLAVHYDEGRLPEKAFAYSMQAAERASRVYAHWDAVELVLRAERNAPDEASRAHALQRLGEIRWLVGRLPEAREAMEGALERVLEEGDRVRELVLRRKILLIERDQGSRPPREIAVLLHRNADEARKLGAHAELCETLWHLVELTETDQAEDVELATEALALAVEIGAEPLVAKGHAALGVALMQGGEPSAGAVQFREALARYETIEDLAGVGRSSNCLAISAIMQGDPGTALSAFEQAGAAFRKVGEPLPMALVLNNTGVLMMRTGRLDEAERVLQEAIDIWHRLDASTENLPPLQNLAEVSQLREDWDEAGARWRRLRDQAFQIGSVDAAVIAECGLARVALMSGRGAEARQHFDTARQRLEPSQGWSEAREAVQFLEAALRAWEGDHERALELLAEAEEALVQRDRYMWACARAERARILRVTGDERGAETAASDAVLTFLEVGAEHMADRTKAILEPEREGTWHERSQAAS